jgi:hypothetical protein
MLLTNPCPCDRLLLAYDEGKDIVAISGGKPDIEVWQKNRQTFLFAFRTLKTEYR